MTSSEERVALDLIGRAVKRRREWLGLTQAGVEARGGPGEATVRRLERGESGAPRPRTKSELEVALSWVPGTIDDLTSGRVKEDEVVEAGARTPLTAPVSSVPRVTAFGADAMKVWAMARDVDPQALVVIPGGWCVTPQAARELAEALMDAAEHVENGVSA